MISEKLMSQYREICTKYPSLILCRVISQEKGRYCLSYENGELQAVLSGKFRYTAKSLSTIPRSATIYWPILMRTTLA